jgi:hypothetical protein
MQGEWPRWDFLIQYLWSLILTKQEWETAFCLLDHTTSTDEVDKQNTKRAFKLSSFMCICILQFQNSGEIQIYELSPQVWIRVPPTEIALLRSISQSNLFLWHSKKLSLIKIRIRILRRCVPHSYKKHIFFFHKWQNLCFGASSGIS